MPIKSKAKAAPKLFLTTGKATAIFRKKIHFNQALFWSRVGVTQSGGSRYESGRNMPRPVQLLLHLSYAPAEKALAMLNHLRLDEKS